MKTASTLTRRLCLLLLCAALLAPAALAELVPYDPPFPDVPADHPCAQAAEALFGLGIFTGDENGNFNPDSTISRAEAAAVVCRLLELDADAAPDQVFTDVPAAHWAAGYVAAAADAGFLNGYGDGRFGPSSPVTYEQLVKMLLAAWGYTEQAEAAGGYPGGYEAVAETLGVTADQADRSAPALRSTAAILMYRLLQCSPAVPDRDV